MLDLGLLPQFKDVQPRLIGDSKLPLGVSVTACGCLSLCQPCDRPGCTLPLAEIVTVATLSVGEKHCK